MAPKVKGKGSNQITFFERTKMSAKQLDEKKYEPTQLCGECWIEHDSVLCTGNCQTEKPHNIKKEDDGAGTQRSLF